MQHTRPGARIVLIAERDRVVRDLESYALERAGFRVEFADDGQEALLRIQLSLPALLITEILLPRMDGLTLCRQLHEDPSTRDLPVLVFSVLSAQARAEEAGAKAYLRKPFVESLFLAMVDQALAAQGQALMEIQ
jgi:CheY-like chemotaxis protein